MRRTLNIALLMSALTALPACNMLASQSRVRSIQLLNDGVKQLKKNNPVRAEDSIKEAIKEDPQHARAYATLGRVYRDQGKWNEMAEVYGQAAQFAEPEDPAAEYDFQRGYAMEQIGLDRSKPKAERTAKMQEAITAFQSAVKRNPRSAKANYHVGFLQEKLDQPEQADRAYRAAIAADPSYSLAFVALGNMYIDYGFSEVAEQVLAKGTSVNNTDAAMWNGLGRAMLNMERGKEAIEAYKKAKAIDPAMPDVLFGLGMAYAGMNMRPEAIENLQEFMQKGGSSAPPHIQKSASDTLTRMQSSI